MDKTYYGSDNKDLKSLELKSMRIDPSHRQDQASLIHSRWFDYAHLHPAKATYLYAHLYKEQTKKFCEAYVDSRTSDEVCGFFPSDIFMSRDMTSMWLARCCADALGMPYEFALQFAHHRALNRLFQSYPRPNQLYGEDFEIDLKVAWEENLKRSLTYSRMPKFTVSEHKGRATKIQKSHGTFVLDQIKKRQAPHHNLLARMFNEDILSPEMAEGHFEESVIESAKVAAAKLR